MTFCLFVDCRVSSILQTKKARETLTVAESAMEIEGEEEEEMEEGVTAITPKVTYLVCIIYTIYCRRNIGMYVLLLLVSSEYVVL